MRQSLRNGTVSVPPSVCPSVCPIYRPLQQRAAGLLLWAPRTGDIDRLLHGASAAGAAAFRSLSADARGRKHGDQQQMLAVSGCLLTQEAEHRRVIIAMSVV